MVSGFLGVHPNAFDRHLAHRVGPSRKMSQASLSKGSRWANSLAGSGAGVGQVIRALLPRAVCWEGTGVLQCS